MRLLARCLLVPVLVGLAAPAWGFVRTPTCLDDNPSHPFACRDGEEPIPLAWFQRCVTYTVNVNATADVDDPQIAFDAIERSFAVWNELDCSFLEMRRSAINDDDNVGLSSDGFPNGNVIVFVDEGWRHPANIQALTSVSYDPSDGRIADADIEFNSQRFNFGVVDGDNGRFTTDIENTLVHEAGHFLGLDHTTTENFVGDEAEVPDATMYATAQTGETQKRTLHPDDAAGACDAYPLAADPGDDCGCEPNGDEWSEPSGSCTPDWAAVGGTPGGGDDDDDGRRRKGCAATGAPAPGPAALIALGLIALRPRRRS